MIALFCGSDKPEDLNDFLEELVEEILHLNNEPILIENQSINVSIGLFLCDALASFLKCKPHSAYLGCERCKEEGHYFMNRIFPEYDARPRTDDSYKSHRQEEHHNGTLPLEKCGINQISHKWDYMLLYCQGATRRLLMFWFKKWCF